MKYPQKFWHCNAVYNQKHNRQIDKGMHPSPKKGDLGIAKNYRGITFTSIAAKIYNALPHNCIEPKIEKIFRPHQCGFQRNRSTTNFDYLSNSRRYTCKKPWTTKLSVDFSKCFNSIHRGKMEQMLLAYGRTKKKKKNHRSHNDVI